MATAKREAGTHWPGWLLGLALGGFFDGILLHQLLQWHHLLSAYEPGDIRFQVAVDGLFHALMYAIAAVGLWRLWTESRRRGAPPARLLAADILTGFGAWHVIDAVASHWLLGIHRIRMDSADPMFWDLAWLAAFGLLPLAAGLLLRRRGPGAGSAIAAAAAALLVLAAGAQSLRPADSAFTAVLFLPGTAQATVFDAVAAVGARVVWMDASGELVVLRRPAQGSVLGLYGRGALLVGDTLPAGCLAGLRT
jgi:uncharacterized membrane protein